MKIGVTRTASKFERYIEWLDYYKVNYEILDYQNSYEGLKKTGEISGLILTGGVDIYPEIYCDWDTKETKGSYNPERDGFELKLIEIFLSEKKPILGLCRGLQIMNIYFRGSLIFDLEEIRGVDHKKIAPTVDRLHNIKIFPDTLLYEVTKVKHAAVTSSHHQAIDRLGEGLMINAKADDGIIEGIEFIEKKDKSFFIGVQWHPERFKNYNEPCSGNIIDKFISECEKV